MFRAKVCHQRVIDAAPDGHTLLFQALSLVLMKYQLSLRGIDQRLSALASVSDRGDEAHTKSRSQGAGALPAHAHGETIVEGIEHLPVLGITSLVATIAIPAQRQPPPAPH